MSASLKKIDAKLEGLNMESVRYKILIALRRFRNSWVDLGRHLTEVAYGADYKDWGYDSFEIYCARELGLKKPTVKKLMISYRYMQKKEPARLTAHEDWDGKGAPPDVPDYQTVELLHKVDENEDVADSEKERFHTLAFDGHEEEGSLRKEVREAIRSAGSYAFSEEKARRNELNDIRKTSQALRRKLVESRHIPEGLKERFEMLLAEIEAFE